MHLTALPYTYIDLALNPLTIPSIYVDLAVKPFIDSLRNYALRWQICIYIL